MKNRIKIILIFILVSILLSGCKNYKLEVSGDNPEIYTLTYHGDKYYGNDDFTWYLEDSRAIGTATGEGNRAYVSKGKDKNKFIEVWNVFNYQLRGYGTFVREDIKLEPPSSYNIDIIKFPTRNLAGVEANEEVKDGVLKAFDDYNNGLLDVLIGTDFDLYTYDDIVAFECSHSEYQLRIFVTLYRINESYYLNIWSINEYMPISDELGEMIKENYS